MPAKTAFKAKGRANGQSFVAIPHACLLHPNYTRLSAQARMLLLDLLVQFKGKNNGDLSMAWSYMITRGWTDKRMLDRSRRELLHYGWVVLTRQGSKRVPSLYAITWRPIDPCGGKLDHGATSIAPSTWKQEREPWDKPKRPPPKIESVPAPAYHCARTRLPKRRPNGEF
jgi:hypothetical protein